MRGARGSWAEDTDTVVVDAHPLEPRLHVARQRVVGRVHVGEFGIAAAIGRYGVDVEDAAQGRHGRTGLVGMPDVAGYPRVIAPRVQPPHPGVFGRLAVGAPAHVGPDAAEVLRQSHMVVEGYLLVAEK